MPEIDRAQVEAWGVPYVMLEGTEVRCLTGWTLEPGRLLFAVSADAYAAAVARAEAAEAHQQRQNAERLDALNCNAAQAQRIAQLEAALVDSEQRLKEALARAEVAEAAAERLGQELDSAHVMDAIRQDRDGWRNVETDPPPALPAAE